MAIPVTSMPTGSGSLGVEHLKRATNGTIEAEKTRLHKATKEFESFFIYQMLKTMRQTIPENTMAKDTPMAGGMGKETFTDLFDMEIARKASFGGNNSIADLLYNSMEKLIDARFETREANLEFKVLTPPALTPIPLKNEEAVPLPPAKPEPVELETSNNPLPLRTVFRPVHNDPVMAEFGDLIDDAAAEHSLDSALISSVIRAESGGNPRAVSPGGAKGLMQLMDSTAKELKVGDPFDPKQNIRGGSRYLRRMLDRFGKLDLALAAYNAGPANVDKYGGVPPFRETQAYVRRVTEFLASAGAK